jgi:hypothetical protein
MGELSVRAFAGQARQALRKCAEFIDNPIDHGNSLRIGPRKSAYLKNSTTAVLSIAAKDLLFVANEPWQVYFASNPASPNCCARAALGTNPVQR